MRTFTQAWASGELADAAMACLPVIGVALLMAAAASVVGYFGGGPR